MELFLTRRKHWLDAARRAVFLTGALVIVTSLALAPIPLHAAGGQTGSQSASKTGDQDENFFDGFSVPEPLSYRLRNFREPTPATIQGGVTVTNKDAMRLWKTKRAVFIDVLPRADKPKNLPKGTIWRNKKRRNIPGGIWLVNVGYGKLNKEMDAYFRRNLSKITSQDKTRPVLFYCLAQCWMSWNAAKRAIECGYKTVYWYKDGTDGWKKAGGKLQLQEPVPYNAN